MTPFLPEDQYFRGFCKEELLIEVATSCARQTYNFDKYGASASIAKILKLGMEAYQEIRDCKLNPNFFEHAIGISHMHFYSGLLCSISMKTKELSYKLVPV